MNALVLEGTMSGGEAGEETKSRSDSGSDSRSRVEIQERGDIFFFYKPKVGKEDPHGAEDVQRLYLILHPHSQQKHDPKEQPLLRLIIMGRKSLPDPSQKSTPYWGFVDMVTTNIHHIKDALKGEEYETATRGKRHQPSSRAVGEGVYRILRHNPGSGSSKMHTHLVYKLEYPLEGQEEGEEPQPQPQQAMNIAREASFLLQIKNPEQQSERQFRGLGNKRKAAFPARLQGVLGRGRYHPADPPDFLNYEGCEFLLLSASDDIEEELGLDLKTDQECSDLVKTFGESAVSTRPLLKAAWV